jgi:flagellar export protein FliJ
MAFRFRFATLLNVRRIQENLAQQALSQAQRQLSTLVAMREQVMIRKETLRAELMTRMQGGVTSEEVRQYYTYLHHLEEGIARINENIEKAGRLVDEKREALLKAKRAHKGMVRLREIHQARYDEIERKREMNFLDEIAVIKAGGER